MTTLLGILGSAWPYILSGLAALGSLLFAWGAKKSADAMVAREEQKSAAAQRDAAEVRAETERERAADAKANADVAQSAVEAAAARADIDARTATMSHEEIQHEIDKWRTRD